MKSSKNQSWFINKNVSNFIIQFAIAMTTHSTYRLLFFLCYLFIYFFLHFSLQLPTTAACTASISAAAATSELEGKKRKKVEKDEVNESSGPSPFVMFCFYHLSPGNESFWQRDNSCCNLQIILFFSFFPLLIKSNKKEKKKSL